MRDSDAPDQPKSAKANATVSEVDEGGATVGFDELKRLEGKRSRTLSTDGSGYVMLLRRGRSDATGLSD